MHQAEGTCYNNSEFAAWQPFQGWQEKIREVDMMFQVVERPKLYEQVVEQIKSLIVQGVYKKGELLPSEKELIEMMGVSRITVREALRLLNEAGVIETHKGKGSFVMVDGSEFLHGDGNHYGEQFLNSTRARLILEPAVAREVALTATEQELLEIEKCAEQDNREFHRKIIAAAHNPVLMQWFEQLIDMEANPEIQNLVPPPRQKSVSAKISEQHRNIGSALRNRNGEFAYFYMKEHLLFMRDIHEEYFKVLY